MKTIVVDDVESVELDPDGSAFRAVLVEHRPMGLPSKRTVVICKRAGGLRGLDLTYEALKQRVAEAPTARNIADFQQAAQARVGHPKQPQTYVGDASLPPLASPPSSQRRDPPNRRA